MSVVCCSVSQEYTASSFRLTDLIRVDIERMGGKKMCQLHREVWGQFVQDIITNRGHYFLPVAIT